MTQRKDPKTESYCFEDAVPSTPDAFRERMRQTYRQLDGKENARARRPLARFAACTAAVALLCALAILLRPTSVPDTLTVPPKAAQTESPAQTLAAGAEKGAEGEESEGQRILSYKLTPEEYLRNTAIACTPANPYYHEYFADCLSGAYKTNMSAWAAAKYFGKTPCPVCLPINEMTLSTLCEPMEMALLQAGMEKIETPNREYPAPEYVLGVTESIYYHTNGDCESIYGDPVYITKPQAAALEKLPCPICADGVDTLVYRIESVPQYHTNPRCAASQRASALSYAQIVEGQEYRLCADCEAQVYRDAISVYHMYENCENYDSKLGTSASWSKAVQAGIYPCAACVLRQLDDKALTQWNASLLNSSTLSEPTNGLVLNSSTLSEPANGLVLNSSTLSEPPTTVYTTQAGVFFHRLPNCNGATNDLYVSIEVAIASGKYACGTCFEPYIAENMIAAMQTPARTAETAPATQTSQTLFGGTAD